MVAKQDSARHRLDFERQVRLDAIFDILNGCFQTLPAFICCNPENIPGANHNPASKTRILSRMIGGARSIVPAVKVVEGQTQT